ncbi:putative transmembrane protein [Senna tora]|uniref:Putative transmembrane protein n=1 Tax=Senna tora TaxID=362788 RepID=A0A834WR24_9FABA|nr:putative transmembrane protein [Senna tora]
MAMGNSIYAAVPAVAAALGFYLFDRNHVKELGRGIWGWREKTMIVNAKEEVKVKPLHKPKLAPHLRMGPFITQAQAVAIHETLKVLFGRMEVKRGECSHYL